MLPCTVCASQTVIVRFFKQCFCNCNKNWIKTLRRLETLTIFSSHDHVNRRSDQRTLSLWNKKHYLEVVMILWRIWPRNFLPLWLIFFGSYSSPLWLKMTRKTISNRSRSDSEKEETNLLFLKRVSKKRTTKSAQNVQLVIFGAVCDHKKGEHHNFIQYFVAPPLRSVPNSS